MNFSRLHCLLLGILLSSLAVSHAAAEAPAADNIQQPQASPTILSRIRGLFDVDLPRLDPPGTIKLLVRPHVSDLVRKDYLRTELGLRWAVNQRFELSAEGTSFLTHGFGTPGAGNGIGELRFGTKIIFPDWPCPEYQASVSFNTEIPVGHPPIDLTDGFNHYIPSLIVQHRWKNFPRLTTFAGGQYEILTSSDVPGTHYNNTPRDDNIGITLGGVYDMGQLKWTLSGSIITSRYITDINENFYQLRPSLLWYIPKRLTFKSKTQWIIGFGTPLVWGPAGFEANVSTRLRAEITFRQVVEKVRSTIAR